MKANAVSWKDPQGRQGTCTVSTESCLWSRNGLC